MAEAKTPAPPVAASAPGANPGAPATPPTSGTTTAPAVAPAPSPGNPVDVAPAKTPPRKEMRRVLVVGASGYIGSAILTGLKNDFEVFGMYNNHPIRIEGVTAIKVDILSSNEILDFLNLVEPDIIIYCVGLDYDVCAENPQAAELYHFKIPSLFFQIYRKPCAFMYVSSEAVYGQEHYPEGKVSFSEKDAPNPKSTFGTSKMSGEGVVMGAGFNRYVFRLATVYGELMGGAFKTRYSGINKVHASLQKKSSVKGYTDQMRNFVYIGDVIRALKIFLKSPPVESTLFNIAGPGGPVSNFDLAVEFCKQFNFDITDIKPMLSTEDPALEHVRPRNCGLNAAKFEEAYNFKFQNISEGLAEMFERLKRGYSRHWT